MNVFAPAAATAMVETRMIAESDDDMFGSTPERAVIAQLETVDTNLSPVVEEFSSDTSSWKFIWSNLSVEQRKKTMELVESVECGGVVSVLDDTVTHLIVRTEENCEAERTMKYLQSVARGLMVVSYRWVEACLQDRSNIDKAEQWEVLDEELDGANGPYRARKHREEGGRPLLTGFEILLEGDLPGLGRDNVGGLVSRMGGRVVPTLNLFSCSPGVTRIVIVNNTVESAGLVRRLIKSYRLATVDKDWLLDTICGHELRSLLSYTGDKVTLEELMKCGYSGALLKKED